MQQNVQSVSRSQGWKHCAIIGCRQYARGDAALQMTFLTVLPDAGADAGADADAE
jgi:hypothetical protein